MLLFTLIGLAGTASTWARSVLPLRIEPAGTCIYGGSTTRVVESSYGSSVQSLPLTGTTTFSFYSPPIASAPALSANDKCSGKVWVTNSNSKPFKAGVRFEFFDYNPATSSEVLVGDSGQSELKNVEHFAIAKIDAPHAPLTIPGALATGHLLHIRVTIIVPGEPIHAALLLNDSRHSKAESLALFPATHHKEKWTFAAPSSPVEPNISTPSSVPAGSAGNIASVEEISGASYNWTVSGGTITAGQGTSQLSWAAGSGGKATVAVTVTKGCTSTAIADVTIAPVAVASDSRFVSITCVGTTPAHLLGVGRAGSTYTIQASEDLVTWQDIGNATADAVNSFIFDDPTWGTFPARFYRAVAP